MSSFVVGHLYATTKPQRIGENQAFTGIWKDSIEVADLDEQGIKGDIQVDRRVHGGTEKALHQYAIPSYAQLHAAFPELAARMPIGSMGENLTVLGMHEGNVHIGDIYRMGSALVQVSQPRNPCWKINSKFDDERLAKFIATQHINGWYYRVLEAGSVQVGDSMDLMERFNPISLRNFLEVYAEHRPNFLILRSLARCQGLTPSWQVKIQQRMEVLQRL